MLESLSEFYYSGKTRSEPFRRHSLQELRREILQMQDEILHALYLDLGKPEAEAYVSELGFVLSEIKYALKNLHRWIKERRVKTPFMFWPARSYVVPVPKGVVLILGPWNYPFHLLMVPLIGALSAGNCMVLKPTRHAPETANVIEKMVKNIFHPDHCRVVPGHEKRARELITMKWDHIFFTGSTGVGREIMIRAAENLTPVTLELGGKNPCIVFDDADIGVSAERIAWGKFLNAGQTCIAPDTVYCHESVQEAFLDALQRAIHRFFGPKPEKSPDYGRIINTHHIKRLAAYLDDESRVVTGGRFDEENLYFAPTILRDVPQGAVVMEEEIFGPILPVLGFKNIDDLISGLRRRSHPLALYIFTKNRSLQEKMMSALPSGSVGINETIKQAATNYLPFGGVGESGMGAYHGKASFDCFSQFRSVMRAGYRGTRFHFPPYGRGLKTLKMIYRLF
ncbi:MAG: aldehyde dehydrogenase family protein [Deltaproteobacteria bacterium]|nr:aldehyde dehydrogenase family protein [Deltaproteobacteria bacterium]